MTLNCNMHKKLIDRLVVTIPFKTCNMWLNQLLAAEKRFPLNLTGTTTTEWWLHFSLVCCNGVKMQHTPRVYIIGLLIAVHFHEKYVLFSVINWLGTSSAYIFFCNWSRPSLVSIMASRLLEKANASVFWMQINGNFLTRVRIREVSSEKWRHFSRSKSARVKDILSPLCYTERRKYTVRIFFVNTPLYSPNGIIDNFWQTEQPSE